MSNSMKVTIRQRLRRIEEYLTTSSAHQQAELARLSKEVANLKALMDAPKPTLLERFRARFSK